MSHRSVPLELAPPRLLVDGHEIGTAGIIVQAHGASPTSLCPACGLASSVHSRYERTPGDFPAHGRRLRIRLAARRFRCRNAVCERRIFTERPSVPMIVELRTRCASSRSHTIRGCSACGTSGCASRTSSIRRASRPTSLDQQRRAAAR